MYDESTALKEPSFEEFGDGIKVTIYRKQANKRTNEQANKQKKRQTDPQIDSSKNNHKDTIREYLEHVEDASSADIAEIIGLSQARTRVILAEMRDEIETIGVTNKRRYRKK